MSSDDERGYRGSGRSEDAYSTIGGTRQTRTRLPDGEGEGYGAARRPARGSRSLVMVVGVVVLLIAAIAFANMSGGAKDDKRGSAGSAGGRPDSSSTAATGTRPVAGKNGPVPSGFAHDEQGAQSAAANYAVALGSADMFRTDSRRSVVEATHTPAVVEGLLTDLAKAYSPSLLENVGLNTDGTAPSGLTFVSRTVPVGTKVVEHDKDAATVEVWCTGLVGMAGQESTKPVTARWFTLTEKLTWVGNDWKIESSSQKEGPTPVNGDNRASTADEIAGAVQGYGGFTYAR